MILKLLSEGFETQILAEAFKNSLNDASKFSRMYRGDDGYWYVKYLYDVQKGFKLIMKGVK